MKKFLVNFFSINELKTSTLIILFFITMCVVLVKYAITGVVEGGMVDIVVCFVLTIGGVNGANIVSKYFSKNITTPSTDITIDTTTTPSNTDTTTVDSTTQAQG